MKKPKKIEKPTRLELVRMMSYLGSRKSEAKTKAARANAKKRWDDVRLCESAR